MGIIQLNGNLIWELSPGALRLLESSNNVIKRGSNPEVLLLQTKLLTTIEIVVRVQDRTDGLSTLLVSHGALVITAVELLEVKLSTGSLTRPQAQIISSWCVKSRNWNIVSHRLDNFTALPDDFLGSLSILVLSYATIELDLRMSALDLVIPPSKTHVNNDIMSWEFPRIEVEPVIRNLDLVSVHNFLLENTISVSQSIAPSWIVKRGKRVQETSSKTTKTTISQSSIVLLINHILDFEAEIFQALWSKS